MDERIKEMKEYGMEKAVRRGRKYRSGFDKINDCYDYYDKGLEECHTFYRQLDKFILANLNRPYKNVYADFCKKWPAMIGKNIDTRWSFRNECGVGDIRHRGVCDFIVDGNGILRKNKDSWRFKKREKKRIVVGYKDDEETYIVFNNKILLYPDIVEFFNEILGRKTVTKIIECNKISRKICDIIDKNRYRINDFLFDKKAYIKNGRWLTKIVTEKTAIEVIEGTAEYTKAYYERKQARLLQIREEKKKKETIASTLLRDLSQAAKRKEEEKNKIDRDRLGFDENSFMGEPYHGQKRKKK